MRCSSRTHTHLTIAFAESHTSWSWEKVSHTCEDFQERAWEEVRDQEEVPLAREGVKERVELYHGFLPPPIPWQSCL